MSSISSSGPEFRVNAFSEFKLKLDFYAQELEKRKIQLIEEEKKTTSSKALYGLYSDYMIPLMEILNENFSLGVSIQKVDSSEFSRRRYNEDAKLSDCEEDKDVLPLTSAQLTKAVIDSKEKANNKIDEELEGLAKKIALLTRRLLNSKINRSSEELNLQRVIRGYSPELIQLIQAAIELDYYETERDRKHDLREIVDVLQECKQEDRSKRISEYIQEFKGRVEELGAEQKPQTVQDAERIIKTYSSEIFRLTQELKELGEYATEEDREEDLRDIVYALENGRERSESIFEVILELRERVEGLRTEQKPQTVQDAERTIRAYSSELFKLIQVVIALGGYDTDEDKANQLALIANELKEGAYNQLLVSQFKKRIVNLLNKKFPKLFSKYREFHHLEKNKGVTHLTQSI